MWAVDLQKNEMVVKDVILIAQGEMALEEFLKQVSRVLIVGPLTSVKNFKVTHND